jgi:hypothetical protein
MFKLKEEDHDANLKKALELAEGLKTLPQSVDGDVVVNAPEAPSSNYDLCLIFNFKTIEDLNAYQADPVHQKFAKFITAVRESRACIDHEI